MLKQTWRVVILCYTLYPIPYTLAQNMPHEVGFWFATNGQKPLITADEVNRGFFTDPTIEHLYYSFVTNGVQSLSVFAEHVGETRSWSGLWATYSSGRRPSFPASVDETLQMTTVGLETVRNLISESGLRVGAGLGLGYGLGGASANVRDTLGVVTSYSSVTFWDALLFTAFIRLRYSIVVTDTYDIGIMLLGRYWSFPAIGPIGSGGEAYNGPGIRGVSELGYLAGISVGF